MSATTPPAATGRGTVLVAGATSAIARATAAAFARRGYSLCLAGRNREETGRIAADLRVRYAVPARALFFDASDPASLDALAREAMADGTLAGAVVAVGLLGDQARAAGDPDHTAAIIRTNFSAPVRLLLPLADYFEREGRGFLAGISSVAGDRGRQSNYTYGAAKGALTIWLQGLRQRLSPRGVTVTTIKPGFVDTRMTYGMPGLFLVADPDAVGRRIADAVLRGRQVVYLPRFWRYIMLVIRLIPERIFARLKL